MDPLILRGVMVGGLVVVVVLFGLVWRRRDGQLRRVDEHTRLDADHLDAVGLDLRDAHAGAVLLGSPTCAPCDAAKQILRDLAAEDDRFRWVYANASDHLALTQDLRVMRVPTVLVVDRERRLVARTSGVPRHQDLRRALDAVEEAA